MRGTCAARQTPSPDGLSPHHSPAFILPAACLFKTPGSALPPAQWPAECGGAAPPPTHTGGNGSRSVRGSARVWSRLWPTGLPAACAVSGQLMLSAVRLSHGFGDWERTEPWSPSVAGVQRQQPNPSTRWLQGLGSPPFTDLRSEAAGAFRARSTVCVPVTGTWQPCGLSSSSPKEASRTLRGSVSRPSGAG